MESLKPLNIAIAGCGGIATGKHLPSLQKLPGVRVTAFYDVDPARARQAANSFGGEGCRVYEDYSEMARDDSIDAVHVCAPNLYHAPLAIEALEAGRHCLCEKPMAVSSDDAKRMWEAAERAGRKLTVAYQNRCRPDSLYLRRLCQEGALGEIYFARAHARRRRAVPTWGVFLDAGLQGGGPLMDIGTHALDLALWMMDNYRPRYVMGRAYHKFAARPDCGNVYGGWDPARFTAEDSAFGFVTMDDGATVSIEASWALNTTDEREAAVTLCGTAAGADMREGLTLCGDEYGRLYTKRPVLDAGGVAFYPAEEESPADVEMRLWVQCLRSGGEPLVKPREAVVVTEILEAVYRSSRSGEPVRLNA